MYKKYDYKQYESQVVPLLVSVRFVLLINESAKSKLGGRSEPRFTKGTFRLDKNTNRNRLFSEEI
jgi:hypothetical protein